MKIFNVEKIFIKLSIEYHNYANVFNKIKIDKLLSHYFYNYKVEFVEGINKNILSKSRISVYIKE